MNCNDARDIMVLLLYGEADRKMRKELRTHTSECPKCRAYLKELKVAFNYLKRLPDLTPTHKHRRARIVRRTIAEVLFTSAAAALLILILLFPPLSKEETVQKNGISPLSEFSKEVSLIEFEFYRMKMKQEKTDLFTLRTRHLEKEIRKLKNSLKEESFW